MELFVGNITTTTTLNDVINLFRSFASKARFRMVEKKMENGNRAYYAVADFDSDKLAAKAIKRLNGSIIRGQNVIIREFIHRSYSNERRAVNWRDKPWNGPERRRNERRNKVQAKQRDDFDELLESSQKNEAKEKTGDSFSIKAYNNMARKF
ncbi:MAG: RNA-binding protein [Gammaproteobacteria bacterium]|nr:RNA-binding protein [Gammaproteobacteria bacterium]MCW8928041.1 RNA-binding protein [Gammaproteobacteria bacterium]MCW8957965.1 RNA-binding protein [Gammaproteobacteria bacterium]MCW8973963.1 RNA-binding protein [Gammaproteobacteria bacterium]MCW8993795.1 RNA-binding protein [Gammaproteobacteria bacterium]